MVDRIAYPLNRDEVIHSISVYNGIATADGLVNQIKCSTLIGANDFLTGKSILIMTGPAKWEVAPVSAFNAGTGDIDTSASFSAVITAGTVFKVLVSTGSSSKAEIGLPTDDPFTSPETLFSSIKTDENAVYVNGSGEAGTSWPIGTAQRPVNNLDDAITIATSRLLTTIRVAWGAFSINGSAYELDIIGLGPELTTITINSVDCTFIRFKDVSIDGINVGTDLSTYENCAIGTYEVMATCYFYNCKIQAVLSIGDGGNPVDGARFVNCEGATTAAVLDLTGYTGVDELNIVGFKGHLVISNLVVGGTVNVYGIGTYLVLDATCNAGTIGVFGDVTLVNNSTSTVYDYTNKPRVEVPVDVDAVAGSETDVLNLTGQHFNVDKLRVKCEDPGLNTVTVRLYELINDLPVQVDSFDIVTANFATYFSLMDMFGVPSLHGDQLQITVRSSAGGPYAVTGEYAYRTS